MLLFMSDMSRTFEFTGNAFIWNRNFTFPLLPEKNTSAKSKQKCTHYRLDDRLTGFIKTVHVPEQKRHLAIVTVR